MTLRYRIERAWHNMIFRAHYRSPVVRAFRALARSLKPWGWIGGGTDCDGMRYAGMELFWTRAAADASCEQSYEWSEGPYGAEVVTGRVARDWEDGFEPDTRDRFAEAAGY